jgi:hypothetical protein
MNNSNTHTSECPQQDRDTAVVCASAGTSGWEDAVRLQRWALPDHGAFYGLAGEIVSTLYALDDLVQVLHRQVAGYAHGRAVYDDTREVDPRVWLVEAAGELSRLLGQLAGAQHAASAFFSAIGHIGIDPDHLEPEPEPDHTDLESEYLESGDPDPDGPGLELDAGNGGDGGGVGGAR